MIRNRNPLRPSFSILAIMALVVFLTQGVLVSPAGAATASARSILLAIPVAFEGGSDTYERSQFTYWVDADGDCQNTRAEVLAAESWVPVTYTSTRRCYVSTGRWNSEYDGATWTLASDVDIDHVVPLKEAWESGARRWYPATRTKFANDLGFYASLAAVTDNVNQSKGYGDPVDWMPPLASGHCQYAMNWVQVKYRWRLTVNPAEREKLSDILSGTCGANIISVPARAR